MTPSDERHDEPHDELRDLLTDAVADVEPEYRLDTIRARTQRPHRRRGWYAVGGAVLAAASVVAAVNLAQDGGERRDNIKPAGPTTHAAALYFIGDTPHGPRLYREYQQLPGGPLNALEAITTAGGPDDPDYGTIWPDGYFRSVSVEDGTIKIGLGTWNAGPLEISDQAARLAIQQVVYTAQAAVGENLPVRFDVLDQPDIGHSIGDVPLTGEFEKEPQLDVLAFMSVSDPAEDLTVRDSFIARGRASSFEGTVHWEVRRGSQTVLEGFTTASGYMEHLYPWETEPIDVSGLGPGRYTFIALTDDPSGGAEGFGPTSDTRTIIVE